MNGRTQRDRDRRVLGQNFLRDRATIARIVEAAELDPGRPVVEAGPGEGLITRELARRASHVTAYELDDRLAASLRTELAGEAGIDVVHADFLTATPPAEPFQFVGAIPYGITAAIVDWCLAAPTLTSATLVTQLEFARKRTGDYGRWTALTITTWPTTEWTFVAKVPRTLFTPVPRVDSAIMRLRRRETPLIADAAARDRYADLVELGFVGRGGSLYRSLVREWPRARVDAAAARAGLARDTVVAFVRPEQWLTLFEVLDAGRRPQRPDRGQGRRTGRGQGASSSPRSPRGRGRGGAGRSGGGRPGRPRGGS